MTVDTWGGPREVAIPTAPLDPTGGRLVAWADSLAAAHRIGSALCSTAFVPRHFAGKPEDAAAAILFGDEIGLTPTQALRSIHVINGTPGLYARTMVALVQSKGHEVWTDLDTPTKVVVRGRRRGSQHVESSEWTVDRARKAGYTSNKKYDTDPQAMLYARAAADVCRKVAPDALAGLAFTVEEIELEEQPATVTVSADPPRRVSRAKPAPVEEPPLDDEPAPDPITAPQLKALHAALGANGLGDRADGLAWIGERVGREVATSKDLTKDEASHLIDTLQRMEQDPEPDPDDAMADPFPEVTA